MEGEPRICSGEFSSHTITLLTVSISFWNTQHVAYSDHVVGYDDDGIAGQSCVSQSVGLGDTVDARLARILGEGDTMKLPISRSQAGLVLLGLGTVFALLGMLVLGGPYGATALVVAVVLLTTGTLLFGTSGRAEPRDRTTL